MRPLLLVLFLAASLSSCAATRHRFAFQPAPESFRVVHADDEPWVHGLVSVLEGRREKRDHVLIVVLRLENTGPEPVTLTRAELTTSGLARFGPPELGGVGVAPGQSHTWELAFPYPAGADLDLPSTTGLHLRLYLEGESRSAEVELSFARTFPPLERSSEPRWTFGVGVGLHG